MKKSNNLKFIFNRKNFDIKKVKDFIFNFFLNNSESIFMIFFVIISFFSFFLIYKYLYSSVWSEDEKRVYLQEIRKGKIEFEEKSFNNVVEAIKDRIVRYQGDDIVKVRDIFGLEK